MKAVRAVDHRSEDRSIPPLEDVQEAMLEERARVFEAVSSLCVGLAQSEIHHLICRAYLIGVEADTLPTEVDEAAYESFVALIEGDPAYLEADEKMRYVIECMRLFRSKGNIEAFKSTGALLDQQCQELESGGVDLTQKYLHIRAYLLARIAEGTTAFTPEDQRRADCNISALHYAAKEANSKRHFTEEGEFRQELALRDLAPLHALANLKYLADSCKFKDPQTALAIYELALSYIESEEVGALPEKKDSKVAGLKFKIKHEWYKVRSHEGIASASEGSERLQMYEDCLASEEVNDWDKIVALNYIVKYYKFRNDPQNHLKSLKRLLALEIEMDKRPRQIISTMTEKRKLQIKLGLPADPEDLEYMREAIKGLRLKELCEFWEEQLSKAGV